MLLFLVRHGETVHNATNVYAGITDSQLTNHGVLQANRLGQYLAERIQVTHIFASDLQRAWKTAEAIRAAQKSPPGQVVKVTELREQDFGSYEGKSFSDRTRDSDKNEALRREPGFKDIESKQSMTNRADAFMSQHLLPLFNLPGEKSVVVVAHGIILGHLWNSVLRYFLPHVTILPGLDDMYQIQTIGYLCRWGNTGYLELQIQGETEPEIPKPGSRTLVVKAIDSKEHLKGLKKTRGGIGSSIHDEKQKSIDSFFKK